jgi:hypothetical protein
MNSAAVADTKEELPVISYEGFKQLRMRVVGDLMDYTVLLPRSMAELVAAYTPTLLVWIVMYVRNMPLTEEQVMFIVYGLMLDMRVCVPNWEEEVKALGRYECQDSEHSSWHRFGPIFFDEYLPGGTIDAVIARSKLVRSAFPSPDVWRMTMLASRTQGFGGRHAVRDAIKRDLTECLTAELSRIDDGPPVALPICREFYTWQILSSVYVTARLGTAVHFRTQFQFEFWCGVLQHIPDLPSTDADAVNASRFVNHLLNRIVLIPRELRWARSTTIIASATVQNPVGSRLGTLMKFDQVMHVLDDPVNGAFGWLAMNEWHEHWNEHPELHRPACVVPIKAVFMLHPALKDPKYNERFDAIRESALKNASAEERAAVIAETTKIDAKEP